MQLWVRSMWPMTRLADNFIEHLFACLDSLAVDYSRRQKYIAESFRKKSFKLQLLSSQNVIAVIIKLRLCYVFSVLSYFCSSSF